jgi:hypothetical protein
MIEPKPRVPAIGIAQVIIKGIDHLVRIQKPDRIGPAQLQQLPVSQTGFWKEKRIGQVFFRFIGIKFGRDYVIVPDQKHRQIKGQEFLRVLMEPCTPGQLVIELWSRSWIAIGQIKAADHHAKDEPLDVAAMDIQRITVQATPGFFDLLRGNYRHPVPALLSMKDRKVTCLHQRRLRKPLVRALELLQAHHIRLRLFQPAQKHRQPAVDAIDVIGRDLQGIQIKTWETKIGPPKREANTKQKISWTLRPNDQQCYFFFPLSEIYFSITVRSLEPVARLAPTTCWMLTPILVATCESS